MRALQSVPRRADATGMTTRVSMLLLLAIPAACTGADADADRAARAFASFQSALQTRDESGCRSLLTSESRQALADLPWDRLAGRQPLQVRGARRVANGCEYLVDVTDPNEADQAGQFVVVREHGRFVVDLVASAGLTAQTIEASGSREEFTPTPLQPADFDRIREYELSQPPANPRGN